MKPRQMAGGATWTIPTRSRVILCEQQRQWAGPVRQQLSGATRPVNESWLCEVRQLEECSALLCRWPGSLLAVEVDQHRLEAALSWVDRWDRGFPDARIVVLCRRCPDLVIAALREAGAIDVLCYTREARRIVELAVRHFAHLPEVAESVVEQMQGRLPWDG